MWISIVISLVIEIVKALLEWWLSSKPAQVTQADAKGELMRRVQKKWYLGKRRFEIADKVWERSLMKLAPMEGQPHAVVLQSLDSVMVEVESETLKEYGV